MSPSIRIMLQGAIEQQPLDVCPCWALTSCLGHSGCCCFCSVPAAKCEGPHLFQAVLLPCLFFGFSKPTSLRQDSDLIDCSTLSTVVETIP